MTVFGFDASKLTDSELEKALALPDDPAAPSPEQTTEADVTKFLYDSIWRLRERVSTMKRLGDDQLEVHMATGEVFQINVNRVR